MVNEKRLLCLLLSIITVLVSCQDPKDKAVLTHDSAAVSKIFNTDTPVFLPSTKDTLHDQPQIYWQAKNKSDSLVAFAKTLIGVPYKYASTNPAEGFDCSGFISYVFNYFRMQVPRSSVDFTNLGKTIYFKDAIPGDLILFTGTDTAETQVGHMGIVVNNTDSLRFIHSTSGHANSVTITPLNEYYKNRFVKVIRIF